MDDQRMQRVEEAVSFAEQRADSLDDAIREVGDRLMNLLQRLDRLETRLTSLEHRGEGDEIDAAEDRPPHSGRLPGDR